ncbi:hypothetical protein M0805_003511 [Coniferiporia weirii]|nr:hypothetical protein M0805_003511 [Coniferiporia weirii]
MGMRYRQCQRQQRCTRCGQRSFVVGLFVSFIAVLGVFAIPIKNIAAGTYEAEWGRRPCKMERTHQILTLKSGLIVVIVVLVLARRCWWGRARVCGEVLLVVLRLSTGSLSLWRERCDLVDPRLFRDHNTVTDIVVAMLRPTTANGAVTLLRVLTCITMGDSSCWDRIGKELSAIWDIAKKRIRRVSEGHQQEIYSLDFPNDGRLIFYCSGDRTARIWDMETGAQKILEINEPEGVDAGVTSVAISPDGRLVAAGSLDTVVRIWDAQIGVLVERLKDHSDSVYSVAFTPDGKELISGRLDKTLKQWDINGVLSAGAAVPSETANGGARNKAGGERGSVNTLIFAGHTHYVLRVARTAQVQLMLQGHKNSVISIDLSPAGGVLATGSEDMQARLWSYTTI